MVWRCGRWPNRREFSSVWITVVCIVEAPNAMPVMRCWKAKFISRFLDRFFSNICQFSALSEGNLDDMCTLLQSIDDSGQQTWGLWNFPHFCGWIIDMPNYIKNNYSNKNRKNSLWHHDYLKRYFLKKTRCLKKINIPIVFLVADTAMEQIMIPQKASIG